ncbi:MAG: hypothetical protein WBB45_17325 [Cyclobacteriaceae bacterium]
MRILPQFTEMLILPYSEKEVRRRLYGVVYPLSHHQPMAAGKEDSDFIFNGQVKKERFSISRRVRHSNSFLPLVNGKVEETRSGSIVYLSFSLFPSTKAFLWFWLAVSVLLTIVFLLRKDFLYSSLGLASGIFCYIVASVSFRRALRDTRNVLLPVLTEP